MEAKKYHKIFMFLVFFITLCNNLVYSNEAKKQNRIFNLSKPNYFFVGRNLSLQQIENKFKNGRKIVSVVGVGGIGKSQLIKKYAYTQREEYEIIWWFDCKSSLYEQYKELGIELKNKYNNFPANFEVMEKDEQLELIKRYLRLLNGRSLIIYDDAVMEKQFIDKYIPIFYTNNGNIITTSRKTNGQGNIMKLDRLKREESIELIKKIIEEANIHELNNLAEIMGDHPLSLAIAASYIKAHPTIDIRKYINIYVKDREELASRESELIKKEISELSALDNYSSSLQTVIKLTLKEIERNNKLSYQIICLFSMLYHNNVPIDLLKKYALDKEKVSELDFESAMSLIINYSLINSIVNDQNLNKQNKLFSIHENIQKTIKDNLTDEETLNYLEDSAKLLNSLLPNHIDELIKVRIIKPYLLDHQQTIIDHGNKVIPNNLELINLLIKKLEMCTWDLDYEKGEQIINLIDEQIAKINNHGNKFSNLTKARFFIYKANFYDLKHANLDLTNPLYQKAIDLLEENDEDNYNEHYTVHTALSQSYCFHGDVTNAFIEINKSKQILEKSGDNISNQGLFYYVISWIYMEKSLYQEALQYIEKGIKLEEDLPFDTSAITNYLLKAELLLKLGRFKESRDLISSLYDKTLELFSKKENHELFARILTLFAQAENSLGNINQAEENIKKCEKVIENFYGPNAKNPDIALFKIAEADVLFTKNDYQNALKKYLLAELIFKKTYIKQESDNISNLYIKIIKTAVLLGDNNVLMFYFDLFKENFGLENKKVVDLINYLHSKDINIPL